MTVVSVGDMRADWGDGFVPNEIMLGLAVVPVGEEVGTSEAVEDCVPAVGGWDGGGGMAMDDIAVVCGLRLATVEDMMADEGGGVTSSSSVVYMT